MSPGYGKTQTDADGNFSFDGLPIGRPLQMSGVKEGYEYGRHSCAVPDSETPMRADFVCKKQLYGGDVVVSVTAIDGSPIPDAILLNRGSSSSQTRQATTDAQGKGTLQNLYSGYGQWRLDSVGFATDETLNGYLAHAWVLNASKSAAWHKAVSQSMLGNVFSVSSATPISSSFFTTHLNRLRV